MLNMAEWIESIIKGEHRRPLPILSFPGIQILNIRVIDLIQSEVLQAECMKAIADRYPMLAAVSLMDLSVEAEAFGAKTIYSDHEVPAIVGQLIKTADDAHCLSIPSVGSGRTGQAIKTIQIAAEKITDRPVLAGIIGPFSLACRLIGMTEIMYWAVDDPDLVSLVLEKATDFLQRYALAFKEAGANGIIMAEPAAGLLSPEWNRSFSVHYVKEIIKAVEDDQFMVVYHNCGNTTPLIADIITTGAMAFHFGNSISMEDVIQKIPGDRLVMGNIDPASQFVHGTEESIYKAAKDLWDRMKKYPNFILSSGCDIPPHAPLSNIDAFFSAVT
ncbi:MAG: uroporphyrinogen decarboxylase family protein [Clostridia bacterium]|nr:uroporphyrinogen decarboxylase family protein [Clostridia bacterium]